VSGLSATSVIRMKELWRTEWAEWSKRECLPKDRYELMAFYGFPGQALAAPAEGQPDESTFATVQLRTAKTKGCGSPQACLTMVFKLCKSPSGARGSSTCARCCGR
jgi:hypothetical protein